MVLHQQAVPKQDIDAEGMGDMGGTILGYLLSNFLIDSHQYEEWCTLSEKELKETLLAEGIMNSSDYDKLSGQISKIAGEELNDTQI